MLDEIDFWQCSKTKLALQQERCHHPVCYALSTSQMNAFVGIKIGLLKPSVENEFFNPGFLREKIIIKTHGLAGLFGGRAFVSQYRLFGKKTFVGMLINCHIPQGILPCFWQTKSKNKTLRIDKNSSHCKTKKEETPLLIYIL